MKKFLCAFAVLFFTTGAFAQLEKGQNIINMRAGLGFQTQNSGIAYNSYNDKIDWGTFGAEIGIGYQYLFSKYFGFGAEFTYDDFDGGDLTWSSSNTLEDKVNLYRFMLSARLNANPDSRVRFYIPFGVGLNIARQELNIRYLGTNYNKNKTDTSLGLFIGAGLEFDVGDSGWCWGIDMRYNTFYFDTEKIVSGAPGTIHGDGNRRYEYLIFALNITKHF